MAFEKKEYREIVGSILDELKEDTPLTDTNVGSVTRTIVETLGRELSLMYEEMDAAYKAGFIDTARGAALDMVVAILGIKRKSAQYATGSVTFSRRKANQDVTIPRDTRVSTVSSDPSDVNTFVTTVTVTLVRGENEVEVPVKAVKPGKEGMADFETITKLESPIIGIDKVMNKKPTSIGTERETDEELRARAKAVVLSAGKTTVESIKNAVLALPGVRGVTVNDMPEGVPGEIDVIVDGPDLTDVESDQYETVREAIEKVRPAGIRVNLKSTTLVRCDITAMLNLTEVARTDKEMDMALNSVRDSISGYINSLSSGENIEWNKLVTSVFKNGNVSNLRDIRIGTRVFDEKVRGLIEDTRKRTDGRSKDVEIGKYERADIENIDIKTQFTPALISYVRIDMAVKVIPTKKTISEQRILEGIENQINSHFEKLRGGEEVDYTRVFNLVKRVKGISELTDLTISALYEESGKTVEEAKENIPVKDREIVKLRDVELEIAA